MKFSFKDDDVIGRLSKAEVNGRYLTHSKGRFGRNQVLSIYTNPPIRGGSNRGISLSMNTKEIIRFACKYARNISPNIPVQSKFSP